MGGKEIIAKLTELDPEFRAIVSSGYLEDPVMANYQGYGFQNALAKPFTILELFSIQHFPDEYCNIPSIERLRGKFSDAYLLRLHFINLAAVSCAENYREIRP